MNGKAPNCLNTGSQVEVTRKLQPKVRIESVDSYTSTSRIEAMTPRIATPKRRVSPRNRKSPALARREMRADAKPVLRAPTGLATGSCSEVVIHPAGCSMTAQRPQLSAELLQLCYIVRAAPAGPPLLPHLWGYYFQATTAVGAGLRRFRLHSQSRRHARKGTGQT